MPLTDGPATQPAQDPAGGRQEAHPLAQEWSSVEELAAWLDVSKWTIYRWNRHPGTGPVATRVGGQVRYHRDAVRTWIEENTKA